LSLQRVARLWRDLGDGRVQCLVCNRRCVIAPGRRGVCGNYANVGGVLIHVGYGRVSAMESRPIEIKPLFHYWPNSTAFTFSGWGCNFYCPWCQNSAISFRRPEESDEEIPPSYIVEQALALGDQGLCASFNEPTTLFDYLLDVFSEGRKRGLYGTIVTNGYQTRKAIEMLVEAGVDGWSIDIKGCPQMTRALQGIDHEKVFRNAKYLLDLGAHVEMVYLVIPNTNDLCYQWIVEKHLDYLGPKVPLHINRYYPAHRWSEPPTPISMLLEIAEYAKRQGVEYVYVGNVHDPELESTYCPRCGKKLIERRWYRVYMYNLDHDGTRYRCPRCGYEVPIRGRIVL